MSPYPEFRRAIADGYLVEEVTSSTAVIRCTQCGAYWTRQRDDGRRITISDRRVAGFHAEAHAKAEWDAIRQEQENAYEAGISRGLIGR